MPCYSPLKGWKDRDTGGIVFKENGNYEKMEVACGQCLGCRLDRSRMWAMRIVHEGTMHEYDEGNCFITLTYRSEEECTDDELTMGFHVPTDWSLNKEHFKRFMKRLRKDFGEQKVRFFHCGEYGNICKHGFHVKDVGCPLCNVGRPHYHAILFNCSFDDLEVYGSSTVEEPMYTSRRLERLWKYGNVDVSDLTFESAAYVARYALKKVTGAMANDHYCMYDMDGVVTWVTPEYITMSRGGNVKGSHGIGYDWYQKYKDEVFSNDGIPVPGSGMIHGVPEYYDRLLRIEDPISYEEMKEIRKKFKLEHIEDFTPARLMSKYKVKKAQVSMLKRSM